MIPDDCLVGLETMTLIVINMMNIIHGIIMYGLKVKFYTYYKVIFWQTLSFVQVLTLRRNKHFKEKKSSSWFLPHKKLWLGHPFCKHCQRHKRPKSWLVLSFAKSMANMEATLVAITFTTRNLWHLWGKIGSLALRASRLCELSSWRTNEQIRPSLSSSSRVTSFKSQWSDWGLIQTSKQTNKIIVVNHYYL